MNKYAVVLALVSGTSAVQWNRWTQYRMNLAEVKAMDEDLRYSDELANGSIEDDKEVDDEEDPDDDIVEDVGFTNMWKGRLGFS